MREKNTFALKILEHFRKISEIISDFFKFRSLKKNKTVLRNVDKTLSVFVNVVDRWQITTIHNVDKTLFQFMCFTNLYKLTDRALTIHTSLMKRVEYKGLNRDTGIFQNHYARCAQFLVNKSHDPRKFWRI